MVNFIKIGAMDVIVQMAGPVTRKERDILKIMKAGIGKLRPKGYDTAM